MVRRLRGLTSAGILYNLLGIWNLALQKTGNLDIYAHYRIPIRPVNSHILHWNLESLSNNHAWNLVVGVGPIKEDRRINYKELSNGCVI